MKMKYFERLDSMRNKILASAAVKVQSIGRGYLARQMRKRAICAITVQRYTRRFLAVKCVHLLREEKRRAAEIEALRLKQEEDRKLKELLEEKKALRVKIEEEKKLHELAAKDEALCARAEEDRRIRERLILLSLKTDEEQMMLSAQRSSRAMKLLESSMARDIVDEQSDHKKAVRFSADVAIAQVDTKVIDPQETMKSNIAQMTPEETANEERMLRIERRRRDREREERSQFYSLQSRGLMIGGRVGQVRMREAMRLANTSAMEAYRRDRMKRSEGIE